MGIPGGAMTHLLSRKQAADFLGLKPQTLAKWATTGQYGLPFVKVGRAVRYRQEDLERWLDERTCGAIQLLYPGETR